MDGWISMHDLKILKKQSQMEERHKIYKCENCDQEFGNKEHLQKHHNSYHHKKASRKMEESHKNHKCESCSKAFSRAEHLKKHIQAIHEGRKDTQM